MSHQTLEDDLFAALASPIRRDVLEFLRSEDNHTVGDLAARYDMARPSFSEHLRILRSVELIDDTKIGRHRLITLRPEPLDNVRNWLHPFEEFWRRKLADLNSLLDNMPDEQ